MKLYRIIGTAWAGTQADAKVASKASNAPWHETEVPTDKPGLLAWLNERNVPAQREEAKRPFEADALDDAAPAPADVPAAAAKMIQQSQDSFTTGQIEDFLLNRATVAQVEAIFACIGTRFAEHRRAA